MAEVKTEGWLSTSLSSHLIDQFTNQPIKNAYSVNCDKQHVFDWISINQHIFKGEASTSCPLCKQKIELKHCKPNKRLQKLINAILKLDSLESGNLTENRPISSSIIKPIKIYPLLAAQFSLVNLQQSEPFLMYIFSNQNSSETCIRGFNFCIEHFLDQDHIPKTGYSLFFSLYSEDQILLLEELLKKQGFCVTSDFNWQRVSLDTDDIQVALKLLNFIYRHNQFNDKALQKIEALLRIQELA